MAGIVSGDLGLSLFFVAGAVFGDVRSVTFCGFSWHLVTFGFMDDGRMGQGLRIWPQQHLGKFVFPCLSVLPTETSAIGSPGSMLENVLLT